MGRRRFGSAIAAALLIAGFSTLTAIAGAQEDPGPCQQACAAEERRCLQECGAHPDPVECESDCRNEAWECGTRCQDNSELTPNPAAADQPLPCVSTTRRSRSE